MDKTVWSVTAMSMIPTADTVRDNKYVTTAGRIKFRVGEMGSITFIAPIHIPLAKGQYALRGHLVRTSNRLLGTTIQLRRASRANGNVKTMLTCISNPSGTGQNNIKFTDSRIESINFDLEKFYYWVQVSDQNQVPTEADRIESILGVSIILTQ